MKKIRKFLSRNIFPVIFKVFPIKHKTIVFSSFGGRNYSGNPRVISEKIQNEYSEFKIVWLLKDDVLVNLPKGIKRVKMDSILASYYLYTAKFWIDDSRKTIFWKKRESQVYFQTWHGTPLKRIEFDAKDKLSNHYLKYAKKDSQSITYLLSGNEYSSIIYPDAFQINEAKILNIGTPRNDQLFQEKKSILENLYNKKTVKVLFAPTFRNKMSDNGISQLEKIDFSKLREFFLSKNQKIEILVKFHPNVNTKLSKDKESIKYLDKYSIKLVEDGIPLERLFSDIDLLITDYSSIFFDYALLGKPLILFNYDEEKYSQERGFYIKLNELPVPKAQTAEMLVNIIANEKDYLLKSSEALMRYVSNYETGDSTKKIIELIVEGND